MRSIVVFSVLLGCGGASDLTTGTVRHPHHGDTGGADTDTQSADDTQGDDTDTQGGDTGGADTGQTNDGDALGIDVSHWDGDVDWDAVYAGGIDFAFAKATQGTGFVDPMFDTNFAGMGKAGVLRGAYHFATPDDSDGATQADFFVENGGDWLADGKTLPGALDIEWNPDGPDCYGLSRSAMSTWIHDFVDEYTALTGRPPVVYCGQLWWSECVDDSDYSDAPLWVASWNDAEPNLPAGWTDWTFWQTGGGVVDGVPVSDCDENVFQGTPAKLRKFASGG